MSYFEFSYSVISALACVVLISTKSFHSSFRSGDTSPMQGAHVVPTLRVGGVWIGAGLMLAVIADQSGELQMVTLCFVLIAALLGFPALNHPFGRVFLGVLRCHLLWRFVCVHLFDGSTPCCSPECRKT